MRISSSMLFQTGLNSINAQQSDLVHLFQQIGSGQRMVTPADDPLAAAQSINIRQSQSMNLRYAENREVAKSNLGIAENTLNSVSTLMIDVKTRLVEAGNGTMSDADRMTLSGVLEHARTTMLGLANATDGNGEYLFSGSKGDVMPFNDTTGVYQGDQFQREIQVDQTRRIPGSDVGSDIFERATPGISNYVTTVGAGGTLTSSTPNSGTGIISTASVYSAPDVNPDYRFEIKFNTDDTYWVAVFDTSVDPEVPVNPADHPSLPNWTDHHDYATDKDNLIKLPFGVQVELSGEPAVNDVFSVTPAVKQDMNVFETLDVMIAALATPFEADLVAQANFQNVLATSMQRLDINHDNVLTIRASVGARFNEIEALDANGTLRNLGYRNDLSRLEDLDYYTATTQLELRKSALEAATLAFRKIQSTSLFAIGSAR